MAFLFTSPLVNPVIVPLFITLLGVDVTIVYAGVAIGMTIMISFILEKAGFSRHISDAVMGGEITANGLAVVQPQAAGCCDGPASETGAVQLPLAASCCDPGAEQAEPAPSFTIPRYQEPPSRWRRILNEAVKQFRTLLPFVILGVAIGSILHGFPEVAMLKGIFKLPLLIAFIASVMVMAVSAGFLVNLIL